MADASEEPPPTRRRSWEILNSPLVICLISGVAIAGGAKLYSDAQAEAADLETRRGTYIELLAEFQRRTSMLLQADGELNPFIGEGRNFEGARPIPVAGPLRREWEKISADVGRKELEILRGTGSYVPTSPAFAGVDFLTIAARMERTAGVPDIQLGALRMLGLLEAPPEMLWLFVRAYLPIIQQFAVSRHMMYTNGTLPLPRGRALTKAQEAALGFPNPKPGDLERLMKETDRLHNEVQRKLTGEPKNTVNKGRG